MYRLSPSSSHSPQKAPSAQKATSTRKPPARKAPKAPIAAPKGRSGSHREQLLAAARTCLEERGYARTTARDLVAASGTNLASIGYHFGSKDALLNEAIVAAFAEYTDRLVLLVNPEPGAGVPRAGIRDSWVAMVEQFGRMRPLLVAFVEAMAQAERNPELREQLAAGYERLRETIGRVVVVAVPGLPAACARDVASVMLAISDGAMVQWLLDPDRSPSGATLFDTLEVLFGS